MNNQNPIGQLTADLCDLVEKYSNQMTAAEFIGVLELHKQELILHHFNEIKKEMVNEAKLKEKNK